MADVRDEGIPEVVSHFRVTERLGSGGMGTVYKGYDPRTDSPVAIKFLHAHLADDPSFRERFEREAHVASLLTSPYTVHLQEAGMTGGRFYIVMEYVEGHTLKDALKDGPLPLSRVLRIALQVSRALEAARAQNIVHRDIKPENVFLGSEDSVKVGDFGIARQEGGASITVTGSFIGTLTYAAPEQMLGRSDHRSDIYALGATLYHMLAGRPPFSGTAQEMFRLVPEVPPPREPLAGQPAAVVEIVLRCLAKDPDERYQTAAELSADIGRASRPGAAVVTEDETIVDQPAEATADEQEEAAPKILDAASGIPIPGKEAAADEPEEAATEVLDSAGGTSVADGEPRAQEQGVGEKTTETAPGGLRGTRILRAGIWSRAGAFSVDWLLVTVAYVVGIARVVDYEAGAGGGFGEPGNNWVLAVVFLWPLIWFLYAWWGNSVGQTIGKRIFRLMTIRHAVAAPLPRTVDEARELRPGLSLGMLRTAFNLVSLYLLGLPLLAARFGPEGRTWHDRIARTMVVRVK